jgi:hypothetical protein
MLLTKEGGLEETDPLYFFWITMQAVDIHHVLS